MTPLQISEWQQICGCPVFTIVPDGLDLELAQESPNRFHQGQG